MYTNATWQREKLYLTQILEIQTQAQLEYVFSGKIYQTSTMLQICYSASHGFVCDNTTGDCSIGNNSSLGLLTSKKQIIFLIKIESNLCKLMLYSTECKLLTENSCSVTMSELLKTILEGIIKYFVLGSESNDSFEARRWKSKLINDLMQQHELASCKLNHT